MREQHLRDIYAAALAAADPYRAVHRALQRRGPALVVAEREHRLSSYERVLIIGAGKATARMALAAEEALADVLSGGLIVVKYGHTARLALTVQVEASHPLPDEAGVEGTRRIIELARDADARTLLLCLLSGGGSSLLVAPVDGVLLADKQAVTDLLLRAGADIADLNAVRKHLSSVKGGRLMQAAFPATVITLLLSDVIGDRPDVIASGPTVPDPTTFRDAAVVLERYGIRGALPERAARHLERGLAGLAPDTPKEQDPCFRSGSVVTVGSLSMALDAAREAALRLGYDAEVLTAGLQGEARSAARFLAGRAAAEQRRRSARPRCLISGGETTVQVTGGGVGGRNQELALAFAVEISGRESVTMLSAGTDGTDGPTDAAGAIVDGNTAAAARAADIDPERHLAYNDSYTFFHRLDAATGGRTHLKTGPTGTNVMDIQIILIG